MLTYQRAPRGEAVLGQGAYVSLTVKYPLFPLLNLNIRAGCSRRPK